jgi:hypothetical protein
MRISGDEKDEQGLTDEEALECIDGLAASLDYIHVIAGSSASIGGAVHIVPPMAFKAGYVAPYAEAVKRRTSTPVFVTGRINQPQEANAILAAGKADVCGMTRALISDPEMPRKALEGRLDDIRACIGCNQACIGHFHKGFPISCIQHPISGRELRFGKIKPASPPRRIMVVGGGPAGMKAAAIAKQRGHDVTLFEAGPRLGGQALLAQLLPDRSEFGGLITNLERELQLNQVPVRLSTAVDLDLAETFGPDAIVIATGAVPYLPPLETLGNPKVVQGWDVLTRKAEVGGSIVVADWRCDWFGTGMAIHLARNGNRVRLAVNGTMPGEMTPVYVRDQANGVMAGLGVEVISYARLFGMDDRTVYLQHSVNGEPIIIKEVDALVLCMGHTPDSSLYDALSNTFDGALHLIGDAATPRTAEEAIFEGFEAATLM